MQAGGPGVGRGGVAAGQLGQPGPGRLGINEDGGLASGRAVQSGNFPRVRGRASKHLGLACGLGDTYRQQSLAGRLVSEQQAGEIRDDGDGEPCAKWLAVPWHGLQRQLVQNAVR